MSVVKAFPAGLCPRGLAGGLGAGGAWSAYTPGATHDLAGIVVNVNWSDIQTANGGPLVGSGGTPTATSTGTTLIDFILAQAASVAAIDATKAFWVKLRLYAGFACPNWVYDAFGGFTHTDSAGASPVTGVAPCFWATGFQAAYLDLMTKLAALYDDPTVGNNAYLSCISIDTNGLTYAEPLIRHPSEANLENLIAAGYPLFPIGTGGIFTGAPTAFPNGFNSYTDFDAQDKAFLTHKVWKQTWLSLAFNPMDTMYAGDYVGPINNAAGMDHTGTAGGYTIPAWVSGHTYARGDAVLSASKTYVCVAGTSGTTAPTNASPWAQVQWDTNTTYMGDLMARGRVDLGAQFLVGNNSYRASMSFSGGMYPTLAQYLPIGYIQTAGDNNISGSSSSTTPLTDCLDMCVAAGISHVELPSGFASESPTGSGSNSTADYMPPGNAGSVDSAHGTRYYNAALIANATSPVAGVVTTGRDPAFWPFADTSYWNLSIATSAVYVNARLSPRTGITQSTDSQYYLLSPVPPDRGMFSNSGGSPNANNIGQTTLTQGGIQVLISIADNFIVPVSSHNNGWAALSGVDDATLIEGGAFCRPGLSTDGGGNPVSPTAVWGTKGVAYGLLTGDGASGGLGGSGMSSLGGSIRIGEFTSGTQPSLDNRIRHALKGNLCQHQDSSAILGGYNGVAAGTAPSYTFSGTTYRDGAGWRWPANKCDGYATDDGVDGRPLDSKGRAYQGVYPGVATGPNPHGAIATGSVPAVRPGALLALRPTDVTVDSNGNPTKIGTYVILTVPGMQIAWTMINYGFYVVNDTGVNSRYAFCTEQSWSGASPPDVATEFQNLFAMPFNTGLANSNWAKDVEAIFGHLFVVDNNTPAQVGGKVGNAARLQDGNPIPPFGSGTTYPLTASGTLAVTGSATLSLIKGAGTPTSMGRSPRYLV